MRGLNLVFCLIQLFSWKDFHCAGAEEHISGGDELVYETVELDGGVLDEQPPALPDLSEEVQRRRVPQSTTPTNDYLLVCNDENLEPRLSDVLGALIPDNIPEVPEELVSGVKEVLKTVKDSIPDLEILKASKQKASARTKSKGSNPRSTFARLPDTMLEAASNWTDASVRALISARMPFYMLIKDGTFTVTQTKTKSAGVSGYLAPTLPDVHFLQKSHLSRGYYCRFAAEHNLPLTAYLCSCPGGSNPIQTPSPEDSSLSSSSEIWCETRHVCSLADAACRIRIDPFRSSCLRFRPAPGYELAVSYDTTMPVVRDSGSWVGLCDGIMAVCSFLGFDKPLQSLAEQYPGVVKVAVQVFTFAVSYTPLYVANIVLGFFLISSAESLAENIMFQYALAGISGLLMVMLWLAYAVISSTNNFASKAIPFYDRFVPYLRFAVGNFSFTYLLFNNKYLLGTILSGVHAFWHQGCFGFPWLGKAAFISSMFCSILLTRWIGLFKPKSMSFTLLLWAVKLIGAALLFQGTSNTEIAACLVVIGWNYEFFDFLSRRLQMEILMRSQKSTIRKVSSKEFEAVKARTTQIQLMKLQQHLRQNTAETDKFYDVFDASGKQDVARNLYKFAAGQLNVAIAHDAGGRAAGGGGVTGWFGSWGGGGGSGAGCRDEDDGDDRMPNRRSSSSSSSSPYRNGGYDADGYGEDGDGEECDFSSVSPTRLREVLQHKSPSTQRRVLKKRLSWWFYLAPFLVLLAVGAIVAVVVLRFQRGVEFQSWAKETLRQ